MNYLKKDASVKMIKQWVTIGVKNILASKKGTLFPSFNYEQRIGDKDIYEKVLPLFLQAICILDSSHNNDIAYCGHCMRFISVDSFNGYQKEIVLETRCAMCKDCAKRYIKTTIDSELGIVRWSTVEESKENKGKKQSDNR